SLRGTGKVIGGNEPVHRRAEKGQVAVGEEAVLARGAIGWGLRRADDGRQGPAGTEPAQPGAAVGPAHRPGLVAGARSWPVLGGGGGDGGGGAAALFFCGPLEPVVTAASVPAPTCTSPCSSP